MELTKETKVYRVDDDESQVTALIDSAKKSATGIVTYKVDHKSPKKDDPYYVVAITISYEG